MIRPMRAFSLNVVELFLTDLLLVVGWTYSLAAVAFTFSVFEQEAPLRVVAIGTIGAAGLFYLVASSGIRQNRAALDYGALASTVSALAWITAGVTRSSGPCIAAGLGTAAVSALVELVRRSAVRARFKPRFFGVRGFETMVQVADVMIEGDGREALSAIEIAVRTDHMFAEMKTPLASEIKRVLVLVEWVAPILIARPIPFSNLGTHARRRVVERVIYSRGPFRDVARCLKMLSCAGYYGSPAGMESVGFVPFDERVRGRNADQRPASYPPPVRP